MIKKLFIYSFSSSNPLQVLHRRSLQTKCLCFCSPYPCTLRGWRQRWFPWTSPSRWAPLRPTAAGTGGWRPSSCWPQWTHSSVFDSRCCWKKINIAVIFCFEKFLLSGNYFALHITDRWNLYLPGTEENKQSCTLTLQNLSADKFEIWKSATVWDHLYLEKVYICLCQSVKSLSSSSCKQF